MFESDTIVKGNTRFIRIFVRAALSGNKRRKLNIPERKNFKAG
jgi:hypothetical protein